MPAFNEAEILASSVRAVVEGCGSATSRSKFSSSRMDRPTARLRSRVTRHRTRRSARRAPRRSRLRRARLRPGSSPPTAMRSSTSTPTTSTSISSARRSRRCWRPTGRPSSWAPSAAKAQPTHAFARAQAGNVDVQHDPARRVRARRSRTRTASRPCAAPPSRQYAEECFSGQDLFDTELILRVERAGLGTAEIPVVVRELRPARSSFLSRVPRTLRGLCKLRWALWKETASTKPPDLRTCPERRGRRLGFAGVDCDRGGHIVASVPAAARRRGRSG